MRFVKFILSIILANGIKCEQMCPADLISVGDGQCMLPTYQRTDYCGAHALCEQEGHSRGLRLFVPGLHLGKMNCFSNISAYYTSLNLLLSSRTIEKEGWRVGDPGHATFVTDNNDSTFHWKTGSPNVDMGIAIMLQSSLRDYEDYLLTNADVICESSGEPLKIAGVEQFRQKWPIQSESLFFADAGKSGCYQSLNERSQLACAYK